VLSYFSGKETTMPLKGFVCCQGGKEVFEACLERAARGECKYPYPILAGMVNNIRADMGITVTQLLNCKRKVVLDQRRDIYVSPDQLWYAFRGQMFHNIAQSAALDDWVVEQRFYRDIAGVIISGQVDIIYPGRKLLQDYKTTKWIKDELVPYAEHALQANIYAWLVEPQYEIESMEIVYMDMNRVLVVPVELMPRRAVVAKVAGRVSSLKRALEGRKLPPKVDADGLWQCHFCSHDTFCWRKGIPKPEEFRDRQKRKMEAIQRARERKRT
jgi:CRISPR/Cas system-associated exonuclease Cas4 (RecB family)